MKRILIYDLKNEAGGIEGELLFDLETREFWWVYDDGKEEKVEDLRSIDIMRATAIIEKFEEEHKSISKFIEENF